MPDPTAAGPRRLGALDVLRGLFLVAAVGFGWWGLREYRVEILAALGQTSPIRVAAALATVLAGLWLTALVWRTIISGHGHRVPARPAARIFFVGQLGKYIPGSVWALGAQADMARRFRVPPRTTVAVGLVFLWVHVLSAIPVALVLGSTGPGGPVAPTEPAPGPLTPSPSVAVLTDTAAAATLDSPAHPTALATWLGDLPLSVVLLGSLAAVLALTPPALNLVGTVLAGREHPLRLGGPAAARLLGLMLGVWALYGLALALVIPPPAVAAAGGLGWVLVPAVAAFAAAYVVGVLVVVAPAGAGAREVMLIALLTPIVGLPAAAAAALLIRVVHTVADFTAAGIAWLVARSNPDDAPEPPAVPGDDSGLG